MSTAAKYARQTEKAAVTDDRHEASAEKGMNLQRQGDADGRRTQSRPWVWVLLLTLCMIASLAVIARIVILETPPRSGIAAAATLNAHFSAKAGLTLLHIVPSLLLVLLLPLQFVPSLRQRRPRLHRWSGRVLMSLGVVIGASALALSLHPIGGTIESSATILFGCFFLFSLSRAWWHIRQRRIELHREWVMRMTAIALGVATTRPIIGIFFATSPVTGLTPQQFFGPAMWLGFTATYVAGEAWIRYTRSQTARKDSNLVPYLFSQDLRRKS